VATRPQKLGNLRILYAGQITRDRGLHTVIEALGHLDAPVRPQVILSVVGTGPSDYLDRIKTQVRALRLDDRVVFRGKVAHQQMPEIYKATDVLVFPSVRDEGLPLTMVEAMLAGCAVVTTGSGGAMEVAAAAHLPLFPKEDSGALSLLLSRFAKHRDEMSRIAAHGQQVASSDFTFERM